MKNMNLSEVMDAVRISIADDMPSIRYNLDSSCFEESEEEGNYLSLPDSEMIGLSDMMEDFADNQTDPSLKEALLKAMKNESSYEETCCALGVIDDWNSYLEETIMRAAIDWANVNQFHVIDDRKAKRS
ncbi:MAG: UPF0158 family protein [Solobacterium sp.]|jgi:hypothetical protein|nr:UPF0158 family protein [Solobacterium sp.]MCH4221859.1 UPF0158 family protein [Solobacterium sp.]MCH4265182.1 UPF0158 family protein [Solobacterium sp.]